MRAAITLGIAALVGISHASAIAAADLAWRLSAGETFYAKETTSTQIAELDGSGNATNRTTDNSITWIQYTIEEAPDDGSLQIKAIVMSVQDADGKRSAAGNVLMGSTFRFTLDPAGELQSFNGYDEFIEKASAGNPSIARLLKSVCTEATLEQSTARIFQILPGPANRGLDRWQKIVSADLGRLGAFELTWDCEVASERPGPSITEVTMVGKGRRLPPENLTGTEGFTFSIEQPTFSGLEGAFRFSHESGWLQQVEQSVQLDCVLNVDANGTANKTRLRQILNSKIEIFRDRPELE